MENAESFAHLPARRPEPIDLNLLHSMIRASKENTPRAHRDAAVVALGWWSATKRSELVAVDTNDVITAPGHLLVGRLGASFPTNLDDRTLAPATLVRRWILDLRFGRHRHGPLFRKIDRDGRIGTERLAPSEVTTIVQRLAERCGLDPNLYSGASLRLGFLQGTAQLGKEFTPASLRSEPFVDEEDGGLVERIRLSGRNIAESFGTLEEF